MENGRKWLGLPGKSWAWLLILVAVFGAAAALFLLVPGLFPLQNKPVLLASPAAIVKNDVTCLGRLLPGGRIVHVTAPAGALVGELLVKRGQWVKQGEILARLRDHDRERAGLAQAEKQAAVAQSELERVKAGQRTIEVQQAAVARQEALLRQEEANFERSRKLAERQVVSAKDFEEAQTRRDAARETLLWERRNLAALEEVHQRDLALGASKIEAAQSARKVAGENVELNLVRAPVSGRVLDVYAVPGEAVPAQGLLDLGSGKDMMVEAEIYVTDIGRVRIGAPATVTGDAFKGALSGKVVEIVPMVSRSTITPIDPLAFSDLRVVKAWIKLEKPQAVAELGNHQVSIAIKP